MPSDGMGRDETSRATGGPTRIADRYEISATLGKGGMGVVRRARDTLLQRDVAIKEIKVPQAIPIVERDAVRARVSREARAAARLNHPNCVTIYDVIDEGGTSYIVMEFVDAPTLSDLVRDDGPLSAERAAKIGLDVLSALEAAHEQGIVHRDVKPANVMVPQEGRAKLADFGIASLKDDPKITTTGMVMGSPSFMAPEQARGEEARPKTDLWALGATLYDAVEGRPPFDKGQAIPTLTAVVYEEPRPPLRAGSLRRALTALMNKDPADRPSVAEARAMLEPVAQGTAPTDQDTQATPVVPPADPAEPSSSAPTPEEARPRVPSRATTAVAEPRRRRRTGTIVALAAAAVALVVAVVALLGLGDDEEPQPSRPSARNEERSGRGGGGAQDEAPVESATFVAPGTGYGVAYPEGWEEIPRNESMVDLRDPGTGSYLRVDWQEGAGSDAAAAWEQLEDSFSARHSDYRRLRLEEVDYKDSPTAALWEYTWTEGGAQLHAYNLGFATKDGAYGFALNFVAHEEDWSGLQDEWNTIMESFGPRG